MHESDKLSMAAGGVNPRKATSSKGIVNKKGRNDNFTLPTPLQKVERKNEKIKHVEDGSNDCEPDSEKNPKMIEVAGGRPCTIHIKNTNTQTNSSTVSSSGQSNTQNNSKVNNTHQIKPQTPVSLKLGSESIIINIENNNIQTNIYPPGYTPPVVNNTISPPPLSELVHDYLNTDRHMPVRQNVEMHEIVPFGPEIRSDIGEPILIDDGRHLKPESLFLDSVYNSDTSSAARYGD